jgi:hypothetical protein
LAFAAFAFATPSILNVFVSDNHPLQFGTRFIAKLTDPSKTGQPFPQFIRRDT